MEFDSLHFQRINLQFTGLFMHFEYLVLSQGKLKFILEECSLYKFLKDLI